MALVPVVAEVLFNGGEDTAGGGGGGGGNGDVNDGYEGCHSRGSSQK